MRTSALAIASLTSSNELTARSSHLKLCFSLNSFAIGFVVLATSNTKFPEKIYLTEKNMMPLYFWPRIKQDVVSFIAQCLECQ